VLKFGTKGTKNGIFMEGKNKSDLKGRRVLVADDSLMHQILTRSVFKSWNLHVDVVKNGFEAVSKTLTENYDLIMIDAEMPGPTGQVVISQIRKNVRYANAPIFLVCGPAFVSDSGTQVSEVIAKPLHFPKLLSSLRRHLNLD
jgi:CheY-like chemotaxis protein